MTIDQRFETWMATHRDLIDARWVEIISLLGGPSLIVAGLAAFGVGSYALTRRWVFVRNVTISVAATFAVTQALKFGFDRIRPPIGAATLETASFPSGHSSASASLYLAVAVELHRWGRARPLVWLAAAAIALVVPLTRLYLGVHWLSDVVVGSVIGAAVVAVVAWRTRRDLYPG